MPELTITIGPRDFTVACQAGEESYLEAAAAMLDAETRVLSEQAGRMPEARMLLMAGLMLADKTAAVEDKLREAEAKLAELGQELEALRNAPAPAPERIEVPMIPPSVAEGMAELAARAESVADAVEAKARAGAA
ncbi:putative cell division protein ZapA [Dinoroseobacter shibae DFL 12 = DSM 16493]|jgi:cell division protein ZapA|uniref:Putative cell division protein ZapA n=1 Tax=Dinoroseobacter shibae (strain DSM 16493 / NCIMB 14021 / DFL 12) TaxID=398580 RepID=A8LLV0_DINSH|nr:cell division protein ZapA [Dinoroseobacter shibae]ABV93478.1 putative cell division protein ZapA [Dinoroseobacter shibae DFL 12 = DSM 16493]URF48388.1 cell division protein ZapA [Dinoroseobacter shibae]URF52698.1 cell division protein ZapA [Dinoroseobacter shibae]